MIASKMFLDEKGMKTVLLSRNYKEVQTVTQFKKNEKAFVFQPKGSQQAPDFIIWNGKQSIVIEMKSVKKNTNITSSPFMWNSHIPNPEWFYILSNKKETICVQGNDIISPEIIKVLNEFFLFLKEKVAEYNNKLPFNIIYPRKMVQHFEKMLETKKEEEYNKLDLLNKLLFEDG